MHKSGFLPVEITTVDDDQTEKLVIIRLFRQHRFRRNNYSGRHEHYSGHFSAFDFTVC